VSRGAAALAVEGNGALLYTGDAAMRPLEDPPAAAPPAATARRAACRVAGGGVEEIEPEVVREALLVVRILDGGDFSLMHTPGDEEELALGFLLAEGWIERRDDVASLELCEGGDTIKVRLARPPAKPAAERTLILHPSCGLCGREDAVPFLAALEPVPTGARFPLGALLGLTDRLRAHQQLFAATGGSHATGLFDAAGRFLAVGEDIGRHAAFDKMVGRAMQAGIDTGGLGAALSGRSSLEMVAKAARARLALVVAVGAPSSAAVDLAERLGIGLAGFARGDELTLYAARRRVAM
jgi:FdhD protein